MKHPYDLLRAEYEQDLVRMRVTRAAEVERMARSLLSYRARYQRTSALTGVPANFIAVLHMRESTGDFSTYLGNGEPLGRMTRLVPKGRGPFGTWEAGAADALKLQGLDKIKPAQWTLPFMCWRGEAWNGFGVRNRGRKTGYLWAGTNVYTGGKYIADGKWSATTIDQQLGIVPVLMRMDELSGTASWLPTTASPSVVPFVVTPEGVGANLQDTRWIQESLNRLGYGPLVVDGSYGKKTTAAVREFQMRSRLDVDGLAGPKTKAALMAALQQGVA